VALAFPFVLLACSHPPTVEEVPVVGGRYWLVVPDKLEGPVPAVVHLHGDDTDGQTWTHDEAVLESLDDRRLLGAFPDAENGTWEVEPGTGTVVRDDRSFLEQIAADLSARDDVASVWLSGCSEGAAMVYDMACEGEPVFEGFLPIAGAFWEPVPKSCTTPALPIRHLQGTEDQTWPLDTMDDATSQHYGIRDSLRLLESGESCTGEATADGNCEVWTGCPADVRLCMYEGGEDSPDGWLGGEADWIEEMAGSW
jgi:polyhydroxybutyrate depolymerase